MNLKCKLKNNYESQVVNNKLNHPNTVYPAS